MFNSNWHSHTIFLVTLSWGVLIALTANRILVIWVGIEVNLIAFIPLVIDEKSNISATNVMKYFLIQVIASFTILYAVLLSYDEQIYNVIITIICLGLLVKMGIPPYHFWLPPIISAISWLNCFYLSSAQKLIPLLILINLNITSGIIFLMLVSTLIIRSIGGLRQTNWRPLIAYSSIRHIVWILCARQINPYTTATYLIVYFRSIIVVFIIISKHKLTSVKDIIKFKSRNIVIALICVMILSIAGLPPLLGFAPKLMVLTQLTGNLTIAWALVLRSAINLWFYLNLRFNTIIQPTTKTDTRVVRPIAVVTISMSMLTALILIA